MNQFDWTPIATPPPLPIPPPLPAQLAFTGERRGFLQLLIRGAGLELVTLGFYRFWLVTDIRRHLWSNTVIDGDAAEYTGRARELLIGFLFALAILMPIYLVYFLVGIEAEHLQALASIPMVAAFYVFGQFAIYRARRYRLTRTVWRGVRFWMDGSGWVYAFIATVWVLFAVVTLGVAMPWRSAALERYKMQHSWYGDLQGGFVGSGWQLFKRVWWIWTLMPLALIVFPALPPLYARYKAEEWRWWLSGIRFGGVAVESQLKPGALTGLYWNMVGWYLLLGLGFSLVVGAATAVLRLPGANPDRLMTSVPLLGVTVVGYLALALGLGVATRLYLTRDVWVRVLASADVSNIAAAANVTARGDLASAVGEGIADGLDVAGF